MGLMWYFGERAVGVGIDPLNYGTKHAIGLLGSDNSAAPPGVSSLSVSLFHSLLALCLLPPPSPRSPDPGFGQNANRLVDFFSEEWHGHDGLGCRRGRQVRSTQP